MINRLIMVPLFLFGSFATPCSATTHEFSGRVIAFDRFSGICLENLKAPCPLYLIVRPDRGSQSGSREYVRVAIQRELRKKSAELFGSFRSWRFKVDTDPDCSKIEEFHWSNFGRYAAKLPLPRWRLLLGVEDEHVPLDELLPCYIVSSWKRSNNPPQINNLSPKQFEKMVRESNEPLFVDGERVYRGRELTNRLKLTLKPEPMFTDKARQKKTHGLVQFRVIFKASREVKILYVLKRLPNGLTEEALKASARIQFEPAVVDGKAVSQTMLLEYSFNR